MSAKPFPFATGDWLKDPTVTRCSLETRGAWFDMLCAMFESNRSGLLEGNIGELMQFCRCRDEAQMLSVIAELERNKTADIHRSNDNVTITVINRRMKRDADIRNGVRERVEKYRVKKRNLPTSAEAIHVAKLFRRKLDTEWSQPEITAFKAIGPIADDELTLVERYYAKNLGNDKAFLRTGLLAFLNNFRGEVDKARQWAARNPRSAATASPAGNGDQEPEGFREWFHATYPAHTGLGWKAIAESVKSEWRQKK